MSNEKKKFYQRGWFLWLMLICFPPVGIILLWVCHKKMNKVIKVILTIIFVFWIYVLKCASEISETDSNEIVSEENAEQDNEEVAQDEKVIENEEKTENEEQVEDEGKITGETSTPSDKFVEDVKDVLLNTSDAIEDVSDVLYEDRNLCVYVDLGQTDPTPLTYEALTMASFGLITDRILKLSQYDDLWDTITVDFGNVGYARNTKDDIMGEGYTRCFDLDKFELITDETQQIEETDNQTDALDASVNTVCRLMTKRFVTDVLEEDYFMFAYEVSNFDLDENNDGVIEILYFPLGIGKDTTKVNLTISKKNDTYELTYALLAGAYEVALDELPEEYIRYTL